MGVVRLSPAVKLTLRNLVNELDHEVSGQIEVNKDGVADILGLYLAGNSHQTYAPRGQITFHTHPLALQQAARAENTGPTNGDCLDDVYRQYRGWRHSHDVSLVCAPEGVYVMHLLPEPVVSQFEDLPEGLSAVDFKAIFLNWYYDIADATAIYNDGAGFLEEMQKVEESSNADEQIYATQMIRMYRAHAGDLESFLNAMRNFGFDVQFVPWSSHMEFEADYQPSNKLLQWTPDVLPMIEQHRVA